MTPILGILVAIACGLALVAVAIIVVLRIRPVYNSHKTNRPQRPGMSGYPAPGTHIPLNQREIDECIDMDGKMITGGTPDLIQHNKSKRTKPIPQSAFDVLAKDGITVVTFDMCLIRPEVQCHVISRNKKKQP